MPAVFLIIVSLFRGGGLAVRGLYSVVSVFLSSAVPLISGLIVPGGVVRLFHRVVHRT